MRAFYIWYCKVCLMLFYITVFCVSGVYSDVESQKEIIKFMPVIACRGEDTVYEKGEAVILLVRQHHKSPEKINIKVTFDCIDIFGNTVDSVISERTLEPGKNLEQAPAFIAQKYGAFKINQKIEDTKGNLIAKKDIFTFSVLPRALEKSGRRINSFFGGHSGIEPGVLLISKQMGMKWTRFLDVAWPTKWAMVEPVQGTYYWHDDIIDRVLANDMEILGTFFWAPGWASSAVDIPPDSPMRWYHAPKSEKGLSDFSNYVYNMVKHYKNRINYWEVWNEYRGTPEEYLKLLKIAYESAKKANPDCKIIGMPGAGGPQGILPIVKAGGLEYMDIIGLQNYSPEGVSTAEIAQREQLFQWIKQTVKEYGNDRDISYWVIETSVFDTSFYDDLQPERKVLEEWLKKGWHTAAGDYKKGAYEMTKRIVTNMSFGVGKYFVYYSLPPSLQDFIEDPVNNNLLDYCNRSTVDVVLRPRSVAYAISAYTLDESKFIKRIRYESESDIACYLFEKQGVPIAVIWGLFGRSVDPVDKGLALLLKSNADEVSLIDVMGNEINVKSEEGSIRLPVTEAPVYLKGKKTTDQLGNILLSAQVLKEDKVIEKKFQTQTDKKRGFKDAVGWWQFNNNINDSNGPPYSNGTTIEEGFMSPDYYTSDGVPGQNDKPGADGMAGVFRGRHPNDKILLGKGSNNELIPGEKGVTLFARIKCKELPKESSYVIVGKNYPGKGRDADLAMNRWNEWQWLIETNKGSLNFHALNLISLETWTDIVAVFRPNSGSELYINGEIVMSVPNTDVTQITNISPDGWYVGGGSAEDIGRFLGLIESVAIWTEALTPEEIKSLSVP